MPANKRSSHMVGKIWRLKNNKSQQNAPRTILDCFLQLNRKGDKCQKVKDLTKGKLESLLHIVDLVRGLDSRMEAQSLAVFLYVARRTGGNDFGRTGVTMDDIGTDLGIAQASVSRNVNETVDQLINNQEMF